MVRVPISSWRPFARGEPWQKVSPAAFSGQGSLGNGAAMRVAPIGAYFAENLDKVVEQARLSAEITHAHPEGIAGGIAIAVATAYAWQIRHKVEDEAKRRELFDAVLWHTPRGTTYRGIDHAATLPLDVTIDTAVSLLGNGSGVTAPDTVPFCLWCAVRHLHNYAEALWSTVHAGGDLDTNAAIVGGIVAMAGEPQSIPQPWLQAREALAYQTA